tara:strand:- start:29009 stop:29251 length:243 start_codon:yes stop_codon:yes gene_type:complete
MALTFDTDTIGGIDKIAYIDHMVRYRDNLIELSELDAVGLSNTFGKGHKPFNSITLGIELARVEAWIAQTYLLIKNNQAK